MFSLLVCVCVCVCVFVLTPTPVFLKALFPRHDFFQNATEIISQVLTCVFPIGGAEAWLHYHHGHKNTPHKTLNNVLLILLKEVDMRR